MMAALLVCAVLCDVAAVGKVDVLAGTAGGRSGATLAARGNESFDVDFDREGRLNGVEFIRGNRVFRTVEPVGGGAAAIEFVAGVFQQTDAK